MIFYLHDTEIAFPDVSLAEEDGLLAIGGDLSEDRLMLAYKSGIFPWYSDYEPMCWYSPPVRCVIFPHKIVISKSMQKTIKRNTFTVTKNAAFEQIISLCKNTVRKEGNGTWITDEMEAAYINLHKNGTAHSIEVWHNNEIAGGIYGVEVNNVFCGESMFSKISNASKAALIWLCKENKYSLIDCQMQTEHLMSMGAEIIPRSNYIRILKSHEP